MNNSDGSKAPWQKFEKHSPATLEVMAVSIFTARNWDRDTLRGLLEERKRKLNKDFVFTPEYIEKFLWIDREIKKCVQKLQQQGEKVIKDLEKLIQKKDAFFIDFEVEAQIFPKIIEWSDNYECECETEDKIVEIIDWIEKEHNYILRFSPALKDSSCYFSDLNWNDHELGARKGTFADYHIGYGMHELCSHSLWSFPDMMRINEIWCDLKVLYQHF